MVLKLLSCGLIPATWNELCEGQKGEEGGCEGARTLITIYQLTICKTPDQTKSS